jgi:hypothetical protein
VGLTTLISLYNTLLLVHRAKSKNQKRAATKGALVIAAMEITRMNREMVNVPLEKADLLKRKTQDYELGDTDSERLVLKKKKKSDVLEALVGKPKPKFHQKSKFKPQGCHPCPGGEAAQGDGKFKKAPKKQ